MTAENTVVLETTCGWEFADGPCDIPEVTRYRRSFSSGDRLTLPRAMAESRVAAGLGRIMVEEL